ncbi:hypothetical protein F6R98_10610 [Candidatus Methylospira mobilis]|uniref:Phage tail protein n=1 Tax=Candidatus Methylospira mobilis TaxID=1808979 RepID=A0A5Q0BGS5_9GAMM|nr:hypothetical protein [Candidatus Methylospira mobilis]QFY42765.1 hypothetical protein F6R98_09125 [Candidatus Methylospira mobilis]QFY43010.1 hypothetical protein F6R98_10610 [Candidatus Methylospira mobilis]
MAISLSSYMKGFFDLTKAIGLKAISSDFAFEIAGFEGTYLLVKQAPWPELTPQGEIEVPTVLGGMAYQPQQVKFAGQGPISIMETRAGSVNQLLVGLITKNQGVFDAKIYEGTPMKYIKAKSIRDCFIQLDAPDRDWENRSQVLTFSGTLFFHYFGDDMAGNSTDYR